MEIKVDIKPNIDSLISRFKGQEQILVQKLKEGVWGYALLVERGAKTFAPVRTGRLRSSISTTFGIMAGGLKAIVAPTVEYAFFVHEGTRYMKGRAFMEWGLNAYKAQGDKLIMNKINEAVNQLGGK